jgi:hypothetical protein
VGKIEIRGDVAAFHTGKPKVDEANLYTMGFDPSKGSARGQADSTALVGVRLEDAFMHVLGYWEQPRDVQGWEPPRAEIETTIEERLSSGLAVAFRADTAGGWGPRIREWENAYGPRLWVPHFTLNGAWITKAWDDLYDAIAHGQVHMDPDRDPALQAHLLAARNRGPTVQKEHRGPTAGRIDLAAAAAYAWRAYLDALAHRPQKKSRDVRAEFF